MRKDWVNTVIRVAFYLMVPMVLSLGDVEPGVWVRPALLAAYNYAFGALALFTVMTLKFTRRQRGFRATPMDFLIFLIALVVPNLPDAFISGLRLGDVAVKTSCCTSASRCWSASCARSGSEFSRVSR